MTEKRPQIAKSGRRYYSVPDGYDVEEWDEMTPYQRLDALGLIDHNYEADDTMLGLDGEETWLP